MDRVSADEPLSDPVLSPLPLHQAITQSLQAVDPPGAAEPQPPMRLLQHLVAEGLGRLPAPGAGHTLQRWQALAAVAQHELSLAKLYEGHADALAILDELRAGPVPQHSVWGMWAAENNRGRALLHPRDDGRVMLMGRKAWCSGAAAVSHGLLTAWRETGEGPFLVRVAMQQPGVQVDGSDWQAVGMAASASADVVFEGAVGDVVGEERSYLTRPGFWQGGAGIAACWYGGSLALAQALHRAVVDHQGAATAPYRLVALGAVDAVLQPVAAALREAAGWIDRHPQADAMAAALRVRAAAEHAAQQVLQLAGRALGATPFCRDAHFSRMAADLPVYLRQSHGDRDLAALGERLRELAGPATEAGSPAHTAAELPWSL